MHCEIILLLLSTHMFCVYLIVVGQLIGGNKLFYFTFCLKGKLMYVWGKISYTLPKQLTALSLNVCLHLHVHYASGSSSALHDFSLKPSGGTGILVGGASPKKMITLDKLLPGQAIATLQLQQLGESRKRPALVVYCWFLSFGLSWETTRLDFLCSFVCNCTIPYMYHLNTKPL